MRTSLFYFKEAFLIKPQFTDEPAKISAGLSVNKKPLEIAVFCLVEIRGVEPLTFCMRSRRATNCAISPNMKETV